MRIILGSDHAGFEYKKEIKHHLQQKGYEVIDKGTNSSKSVDYPDYVRAVVKELGEKDRGILICGTGIGMSICANRRPYVRAALCYSDETAELARRHNDANVLCLGARQTKIEKALEWVDIFLNTEFEGGRHLERVRKINRNG